MKLRSDSSQRKERLWKIPLIIYFIVIIASTIAAIVTIWNPLETPIVSAPVNTVTPNNIPDSNDTQLTVNIPTESSESINDWRINREKNLIIVNTLFGILGGATYGLASITTWIGNNKYGKSWTLWYISRPIIGGALALMFYFLLRAGLVGGFPVNVGDFGFAAISMIIGLLTTTAMKKIRDIFDVLFGIEKSKEDIGDEPALTTATLKLAAPITKIKIGEETEIRASASNADGTYSQGSCKIKIENPAIANFAAQSVDNAADDNITFNFQDGVATVKVKGVSKGKTNIVAESNIDEKELSDRINIEVIETVST